MLPIPPTVVVSVNCILSSDSKEYFSHRNLYEFFKYRDNDNMGLKMIVNI